MTTHLMLSICIKNRYFNCKVKLPLLQLPIWEMIWLYQKSIVSIDICMKFIFKGHLLSPIITTCNISLRCAQNVSVKFQLKILHRSFYYIILKMPILSGSRNTHSCLIALKLSLKFVKNTHKFRLCIQKESVMSLKVNSWERNCMFILDLCMWQRRNIAKSGEAD